MYKGADISSEDAPILMGLLPSSLDFIIPREGYGTHRDLTFSGYVRDALNCGLKVPAVYHTIEAYDILGVSNEATRCMSHVNLAGLPKSTVIFGEIDYELLKSVSLYSNDTVKDTVKAVIDSWFRNVKALGYNVGLLVDAKIYPKLGYSNRKYIEDNGALWLIDVHGDPDYPCAVHKYTHCGIVEGMKRDAELNLWYDEDLYKGKIQNANKVPSLNEVRNFYKKYLNQKITKMDVGELINTYNENCKYYGQAPIKPDEDWSAVFISAVAIETNAVDIIGVYKKPVDMLFGFADKDIWEIEDLQGITIGDIPVIQLGDRYCSGFVTAVNDGNVKMIGVDEKGYLRLISFDINDKGLLGYARPNYRLEEKEN